MFGGDSSPSPDVEGTVTEEEQKIFVGYDWNTDVSNLEKGVREKLKSVLLKRADTEQDVSEVAEDDDASEAVEGGETKEDGDGAGVSRNEFGMVLNAEGLPEVAIMALFGQVDVNKSGTITKDEITSVFPTEAVVNLDEELKDGGQSPVEWVGFWRKLFDSKDKHNVGLYLEKCLEKTKL